MTQSGQHMLIKKSLKKHRYLYGQHDHNPDNNRSNVYCGKAHLPYYPFSYRLKIDGMVCSGCVRKVENVINSTGGLWANADLRNKEVYVLAKRAMTRTDFVHMFEGTSYTVLEVV